MLNHILLDCRWGARVATDNPSTSYRHGIPHPCRALDLSCSGALLLWPHDSEPPMVQRLELQLGERVLTTLARTVWTHADTMAVRFIGLDDADRLDIAEYLDHIEHQLH